jgi:hypothetical protein
MFRGGGGDRDCIEIVAGKQCVKIMDKRHSGGVGSCLPSSEIVVPDSDQFGVRVLAYARGVLGCMDVPESENRNSDRIGHLESLLEIERVLAD